MTTSLWEQVRRTTATFKHRTCVIEADTKEELSFEQIAHLFSGVAERLATHGLAPQDRVALLMRNSSTFLAIEGACAALGITCVPVNFYSSVDEVVHHVQHSGARAMIFDLDDDDLPRLEIVQTKLDQDRLFLAANADAAATIPAWSTPLPITSSRSILPSAKELLPDEAIHRIMYTSATTGVAKGVLCPYGNWIANTVATASNQLRDVTPADRYLAATPFTHMSIGYFWSFYSLGATTVSMRKFTPARFADMVLGQEITHTLLVPTMVIDIVKYLRQNPEVAARLRESKLRAIWYAGSPMPPAIVEEAVHLLGPIFNQQYGLTEMFSVSLTMCATMLPASEAADHPGSCGRALTGTSVRVVDEQGEQILEPAVPGELLVKLTGVLGGYLDNPTATKETFGGGWLHTGDIATLDADGYVTIVDRQKDMIISGGFNVYSAEVEGVLQSHAAVASCAVVGRPDPTWVEVPVAFVVKETAVDVTEEELIGFARERLARFKAPKAIRFLDELPKNSIGKVAKRSLRAAAVSDL